jgi:hypothetical protein
MDFPRKNIGQVVYGKSAFVRNHGLGTAPQPSHKEILETRGRELSEAINSMREPLETPLFRVFRHALPGKARPSRLPGREVSGLGFGKMIERVVVWRLPAPLRHCVHNLRK